MNICESTAKNARDFIYQDNLEDDDFENGDEKVAH